MKLIKKIAKILPYFLYVRLGEYVARQRKSSLLRFIDLLNIRYQEEEVRVLDIGARQGLGLFGYRELKSLKSLYLEGVEPDREEAERLESNYEFEKYAKVHAIALSNFVGEETLYMTKHKGCSSIREPLNHKISPYTCSSWFEKDYEVKIPVVTLSDLYPKQERFDFIKIDVQAAEYEILEGGRNIISESIGVTLEVQFTEFYHDQKLFPQIHDYLSNLNFRLIFMDDIKNFYNGEIVEANCAYIKEMSHISSKSEILKHILFSLMCNNEKYVEFLLRNAGNKFLSEDEIKEILKVVDISLKFAKLPCPVYSVASKIPLNN